MTSRRMSVRAVDCAVIMVERVDLGCARGVPFGFADACALPDGRIVFLAGAEDSPDTDGAVLGTRGGVIDGGRIILADIVDPCGQPTALKLEGVDFVGFTPTGGLQLVVVVDMDDADAPAVLASLHWGLP